MMTQLHKTRVLLYVAFGLSIAEIDNISAQEGQLVDVVVHSVALEGNLLEDSPDRNVTIYLPPAYNENTNQRYPVIYLIHGFTGTNRLWTGSGYLGSINIKNITDAMIKEEKISPMIIVMPNARTRYLGPGHKNGPVMGNWETFFTEELINYVDSNYRTLPQAASRGISGHSGGGFVAIKYGMLYPEVYGAVYGMSSCCLDFEKIYLNDLRDRMLRIIEFDEMKDFDSQNWLTQTVVQMAADVAPNPDTSPFLADFPLEVVDGDVQLVEAVWERWLQDDPLTMVPSHRESLLQLSSIGLDCGTQDDLIDDNRKLSQALLDAGIPHIFEEFDGNHVNRGKQQIETNALPFFSEVLSFELEPTAVEKATWGRIKTDLQK